MKRSSPLTRRTPLRRTTFARQRQAYPSREQLEDRRMWGSNFSDCWICGTKRNLQTHEIASKAQAPGAWADFRNYFRCCGPCNSGPLNWLPEATQLAIKAIEDPGNYDREFVNDLRHRASNAISKSDVEVWLTLLRKHTQWQ